MINLNPKKIFLILTIILLLFVIVIGFIVIYELHDVPGDPDEILSRFKLGSKIDSLPINEKEVFFRLKSNDKFENMNIIIRGYEHPEKYLEENQELILIGIGEYIVYLYFDDKGILIDKEIVGS